MSEFEIVELKLEVVDVRLRRWFKLFACAVFTLFDLFEAVEVISRLTLMMSASRNSSMASYLICGFRSLMAYIIFWKNVSEYKNKRGG